MVIRELVTKYTFSLDQASVTRANNAADSLKKKSTQLGKKGTEAAGKLGGATDKLGGKFTLLGKKGTKNLGELSRSFNALASSVGANVGILGNITALLNPLTVAIAALAFGVFKAGQAFISFDESMKKVKKTLMATEEEMSFLKNSAKDAAAGSVFNLEQTAEAMNFLAMAGLDVKQVAEALPGALQLASAGSLDLASAADISTNILTSNELVISDLARVNDVLAVASSKSNTNVRQLGEAFATLGASGVAGGLSIETLTTSFGLMADAGVRGGIAGTLLRNAIDAIRRPTEKLRKSFAMAGIDLSDFVNKGKITNFEGLLQALRKAGTSADVVFDRLGERGGRAMEQIARRGQKSWTRLFSGVEDSAGAAAQKAAVDFEGVGGAFKQLSSLVNVALVKAFESSDFEGALIKVAEILIDVLPPAIRLIGNLLRPIGLALRVALFPLSMLMKVVGVIASLLTKSTNLLTLAFGKLFDFFDDEIKALEENVNRIGDIIKNALFQEFIDFAKFMNSFLPGFLQIDVGDIEK